MKEGKYRKSYQYKIYAIRITS